MASAQADSVGEARFFADCPRCRPVQLHDERHPWDLHALLYTTLGLSELEVVRLADGLVDVPLPGAPMRPFTRLIDAIRAGYHRLPPWTVTQRAGEFVDAWQLPEVSLGDASATYSVATGGEAGPGSGMLVRVHKLIDWTQHVAGDVNRLGGRLIGRPRGAITWSGPERLVDGVQWLFVRTFHHVSLMATRVVDHSLTGVEVLAEGGLNFGLGRRRPHQDQTVFLRLPMAVYRAHELWILEHRPRLVIGRPEEFAGATHASFAHGRRRPRLAEWDPIDPTNEHAMVILMTSPHVIARAPASLRPYVVPAAWVLNE